MALTGDETYGTVIAGFVTDADGNLSVTTDANGATWQGGFLRDPDGRLVVAETTGTPQGGYVRTDTGALCVSTGTVTDQGSKVAGLPTDANGVLVVVNDGTPAASSIFSRFRFDNGKLCVTGLAPPEPYRAAVISTAGSDLDLYWRLGVGGTVDQSSNGRNGTAAGGVTIGGANSLVPSETDKATLFDGTDDRVTGPAWDTGTNFTVIAWVKTTSSGLTRIIVNRSGANPNFALRVTTTGKASFLTYASGGSSIAAISTTSINDGNPHMIAATCQWDGTTRTAEIYVDGVLETTNTVGTIPLAAATNPFNIVSDFLAGTVDEVSQIKRVLTASEIDDLYAIGTNRGTLYYETFASDPGNWAPINEADISFSGGYMRIDLSTSTPGESGGAVYAGSPILPGLATSISGTIIASGGGTQIEPEFIVACLDNTDAWLDSVTVPMVLPAGDSSDKTITTPPLTVPVGTTHIAVGIIDSDLWQTGVVSVNSILIEET